MNPLTNMKNVVKLSERELGSNSKTSWHDQYKGSAWIFVGGFPYDLTEGDLLAVFSQYGEIVNVNLIRDKKTGKQKGFCFICYEDQRSTVLAVDNLNGIKILGKALRVDHVNNYKPPKDDDKLDDVTRKLHMEGCAPQLQIPVENIKKESMPPPSDYSRVSRFTEVKQEKIDEGKKIKKEKKVKKEKKEKKSKKSKKQKKRKRGSSDSDEDSSDEDSSHKSSKKSKKKNKKRKYSSSDSDSDSSTDSDDSRRRRRR